MTRVGFAVAAISATVVVAMQEMIKECCTSAQAQTQTASPEPTIWDHNGSVAHPASSIIKSPVQECWMQARALALYYSAVRSTTDNIWEQHISLTLIAGQSRSKSQGRFLTMKGSC
jgi:hypothetical protein